MPIFCYFYFTSCMNVYLFIYNFSKHIDINFLSHICIYIWTIESSIQSVVAIIVIVFYTIIMNSLKVIH